MNRRVTKKRRTNKTNNPIKAIHIATTNRHRLLMIYLRLALRLLFKHRVVLHHLIDDLIELRRTLCLRRNARHRVVLNHPRLLLLELLPLLLPFLSKQTILLSVTLFPIRLLYVLLPVFENGETRLLIHATTELGHRFPRKPSFDCLRMRESERSDIGIWFFFVLLLLLLHSLHIAQFLREHHYVSTRSRDNAQSRR